MLPNFLLIGAAKSGTTSLYRYLGQHPEIFMSPINPDYSPGSTVRRATGVTAAAGEPARRLASPCLVNNPG
jgi:hypothetical protein